MASDGLCHVLMDKSGMLIVPKRCLKPLTLADVADAVGDPTHEGERLHLTVGNCCRMSKIIGWSDGFIFNMGNAKVELGRSLGRAWVGFN